jgi:hypothetical protein
MKYKKYKKTKRLQLHLENREMMMMMMEEKRRKIPSQF